jgi:hypothetical protein
VLLRPSRESPIAHPRGAHVSTVGAPTGDVAAWATGPERLGAELAPKLHETPDLGAVESDVGLDVDGGLGDGGQVDTE